MAFDVKIHLSSSVIFKAFLVLFDEKCVLVGKLEGSGPETSVKLVFSVYKKRSRRAEMPNFSSSLLSMYLQHHQKPTPKKRMGSFAKPVRRPCSSSLEEALAVVLLCHEQYNEQNKRRDRH